MGEERTSESLIESLRHEQQRQWEAGQRTTVESYFLRHPEARADVEVALELIYNEVILRHRAGNPATLQEFQDRFPHLAARLELLFEVHAVLGPSLVEDDDTPRLNGCTVPGLPTAGRPIVPGFEILGEVGRGGMSVVYEARQLGLNRKVALKMLLAGGYASREERARFRTEAEALGRLQHPDIVPVHEVGENDGRLYLVLEYVEGGSLAQALGRKPWADGGKESFRRAAHLVEVSARAVHHAHQQGIVHRDLKPANILLAHVPESGREFQPADCSPKITDFGLAKLLKSEASTSIAGRQTQSGAILGTPAYMAPEQAEGRGRTIGPSADVYSLGAILYELLAGRPPFQGATPLETMIQVITQEPVSPSCMHPGLPRDLVTVCMKALAKEPPRRYASAAALADDLRRFLDDVPVKARQVTSWERKWRWCRRNPMLTALSAAAALFLVFALFVGGVAALVARERNIAIAAKEQAEIEQERAQRAELQLAIRSHLARAASYRRSGQAGQRFQCLAEVRAALRLNPSPEQRRELRDEAAAALVLPDLEVAWEWDGRPPETKAVAFDDSLSRYARLTNAGKVIIYRLIDGSPIEVGQFRVPAMAPFASLLLSPDAEFVVILHSAGGPGSPAALAVWRLDWRQPTVIPFFVFSDESITYPTTATRFGANQRRILAFCSSNTLRAYDLDRGQPLWKARFGQAVHDISFQPRGDIVALDQGSDVLFLDSATGRQRDRLAGADMNASVIWSLAWQPDGQRLATACNDRRIHLWDVRTGRPLPRPWEGHFDQGIEIAFNHAGNRLISFDYSRQMQLWDALAGYSLMTLSSPGMAGFSRDDQLIGPQWDGKRVRILRVASGNEMRMLRPGSGQEQTSIRGPVLDSKDRVVAGLSGDGISLFDLVSGKELASARIPFANSTAVHGFIPRTGWVMSTNAYPQWFGAHVWPVRHDARRPEVLRVGPPRFLLPWKGSLGAYSSPDGKVLALADGAGALIINREGTTRRQFYTGAQRDARVLAVSPDHQWIATCSWTPDPESSIRIWDARTGRHVHNLPIKDGYNSAWFSPDSRWLFTAALGQRSHLWSVPAWQEMGTYVDTTVAFAATANEDFMAIAEGGGQIRLLKPGSNEEIGRLTGPDPIWYNPVCFTADGARLIAETRDHRAIYVWDLRAIRRSLKELGLDWDLPALPPEPPIGPRMQVEIDRGWMANEADFPDPRQAVGLFSFVIALQPLSAEAYLQRGRAYGRMQRHAEAVCDYSSFLVLSPITDPRRAEILYRRAINCDLLKNESAARRDLLAMADLDLSNIPWPALAAERFHTFASRLVCELKDTRESGVPLQLARTALRIEPDIAFSRGVLEYRRGHWNEAVTILEDDRSHNTDFAARDLVILAMCRQRLGERNRGRNCLKQAIEIHDKSEDRLSPEENEAWKAFRAEAESTLNR